MQLDDDTMSELQRRLRRVEGQVRGIQQMLEDGRACRDVITQVSAASRAIDQVGLRIIVTCMTDRLADRDNTEHHGFDMAELERLFLKLA